MKCNGVQGKHHRWPQREREWKQIHCLDCGAASHLPTHSEDTPWWTKPIPESVRERIEKKLGRREATLEFEQARRIVERMSNA